MMTSPTWGTSQPSATQDSSRDGGPWASPALPAVSLPKGGGAIRGIGEKFAANPVTGTGSMSVPIATSPGRSGFGPQLSLIYDSGAGNGPFGFGWSLSLPAITRKTDKGLPQYLDAEESDVFILSGAEDLVSRCSNDANGDPGSEDAAPRCRPRLHRSTATARASRGSSPASSAGPSSARQAMSTGARSPRTTSSPSTGSMRTRASPIPWMQAASSAG